MRLFTTLSLGLICTSAFAQVAPTGAISPPANVAGGQGRPLSPVQPVPGTTVSQHAHVRAFNAGPDGQVRSVYLSNGTVVNLAGFGPGVASQIHKGSRIGFTGTRTVFNGQAIVTPQQLIIGQQTFSADPTAGPNGLLPQGPVAGNGPVGPGMPPPYPAGGPGVPLPPPVGPGAPPSPPPSGRDVPPPPPALARGIQPAQPGVAPVPAAPAPHVGTTVLAPPPPTAIQTTPDPSSTSIPQGSAAVPPPSPTANQ